MAEIGLCLERIVFMVDKLRGKIKVELINDVIIARIPKGLREIVLHLSIKEAEHLKNALSLFVMNSKLDKDIAKFRKVHKPIPQVHEGISFGIEGQAIDGGGS